MSVFSKIKLSRKAAKDHKAAGKEKDPNEVVNLPYKHTPTHAAVDALSGAPSSWSRDDRSKIKAQHQRRSQMIISRTGSSVSTASFMNSAAGPSSRPPPLPRNSSYSSYNPNWFDRSGDVYLNNESKQGRHKSQRGPSFHDSGIGPSPLASNVQSEEVSPVVSSGNSTSSSSSDNLELATPSSSHRQSVRPQPTVYAEQDIFDRLHTSTTRKLGEAPLFDGPPPAKPKSPVLAAVEQKQKKQRWSLMGKKNAVAVAA